MKHSWAQPSISRDFALLAASILFLLLLVSAWVGYTTYARHTEHIRLEMEKGAIGIEHTLATQMNDASYMLTALGRQIVLDPDRNPTKLAQILESFDSKGYIYTIFSWVNPQQRIAVSSNKGVLDEPVDISDREYIRKALAEPWKMMIGGPVEGRVSNHWVIPVAMGLTDYTGRFIGTILISIDINVLTDRISTIVKRDGISFAIVSKTLIPLTQVSEDQDFLNANFPTTMLADVNFSKTPNGLIVHGSPLWGMENYAYYRISQDYPYIILLGFDPRYSEESVQSLLWPRLMLILGMGMFFMLFLWLMRLRMIRPVLDMTIAAAGIARGEPCPALPAGGAVEIAALAAQIRHLGEYIEETRRIENELRHKLFLLRQARTRAEMDKRGQLEWLAHVCHAMHTRLNTIIGAAQVMKEQLYGPIENRKYRQYALDIYSTGNRLLEETQELLTLAGTETGYIVLTEKPVDVKEIVNNALGVAADRLAAQKVVIRLQLPESLPKLTVDAFRLQQILVNLLLHTLEHMTGENTLLIETSVIKENGDKPCLALIVGTPDRRMAQADLTSLAARLASPLSPMPVAAEGDEPVDIGLELAKALITLHHGTFDITRPPEGGITITVLFGASRIQFTSEEEK